MNHSALTIIGFDYVGLLLAQHDEVMALASPEPLALPFKVWRSGLIDIKGIVDNPTWR